MKKRRKTAEKEQKKSKNRALTKKTGLARLELAISALEGQRLIH